ncbi:sugar transferase [Phyllobacterium leguminum]|uniref:Lipopolysaccharide/colanic/teichoic acid biosynthesis glycosyltransferase n=1 Tax=Phyllobacterium leguminum TaxID=314237 RepID=A0A318T513_9HYPH|nr:sugar transferase [Phyllobacterium leguminum]PYE87304.1 lipopolysaccharide/colanic/teichoic acid biosynthesis glycosyltransferase [Phyllobacterium leguminum]
MYVVVGKRAFDLALALLLAVPALFLCILCVVAIRLERTGPAIFRQIRVGRHKRPFVLYKLRTMSLDTGDRASHEVAASQITRSGRFLRRTKLDELPQLLNVLLGEMSFVGPRPCLPSQHELIAERAERGVFRVRPGITGPAQLQGIDMSTPRRLAEVDAAYAKNPTLLGDLESILHTAVGRGSGDAVKGERG